MRFWTPGNVLLAARITEFGRVDGKSNQPLPSHLGMALNRFRPNRPQRLEYAQLIAPP
jgi:hypothetical protein